MFHSLTKWIIILSSLLLETLDFAPSITHNKPCMLGWKREREREREKGRERQIFEEEVGLDVSFLTVLKIPKAKEGLEDVCESRYGVERRARGGGCLLLERRLSAKRVFMSSTHLNRSGL
jgi:hypothetical protein